MDMPSAGRMVHYVSFGTPRGEYTSQCRAAVIAEVGGWVTVTEQHIAAHDDTDGHRARDVRQWWYDDACGLAVLNPTGQFFNSCAHDEAGRAPGTWHWPERV